VVARAMAMLADERWAARKRAVEILGRAGGDDARKALAERLAVEQNYELKSAIEKVLQA
jgi:HEAT repeat protein